MGFNLLQSEGYRGADVVTLSDTLANANSKILSLDDLGPEIQRRYAYVELLAIRIELTTTATGGNRELSVRLEEPAAVPVILYEIAIASNSLGPSKTKTWQLAPEVSEISHPTQDNQVKLPPQLYVHAHQRLVIEDTAAIDSADDMVVHVMGRLFDIRSL